MRRDRVAQALAFVALLAAFLGALGPADRVQTSYSWPPKSLPSGAPDRHWYAPLLLIRHRPATMSARVPCTVAPALPDAGRPVTVLATARDPERIDALRVARRGDQLSVSVGRRLLANLALPSAGGAPAACAYNLRLGDGQWSIDGGPEDHTLRGPLELVPTVTGLFSSLDLRAASAPSIDITTAVHAARPTTRQALAWVIAALASVAAVLLVAFERRPRRVWSATTSAARRAIAHAHPTDPVVALSLLAWLVISPVYWDDGWIVVRTQMFSESGGFTHYYNAFGINLPLDYWLEWLQHWLVKVSSALVFLRVLALVCLMAMWVLCRWIVAHVLPAPLAGEATTRWALASAFLVGTFAWGMTLRPEPAIALLAVAVMVCMVRFTHRATAAPLAATAILVPLALAGHHTGIVSLAPVLVATPSILRWARNRVAAASALVGTTVSLLIVLVFVGSDLEQRRTDILTYETFAGSVNWRNEPLRYVALSFFPAGTPIRRASVALLLLAVLAWLIRRRRATGVSSFPAATLAVALLLLTATPSKWEWHFGALIGLAAIAVATETAGLREQERGVHVARALPYFAVGAATFASAWSWWPRTQWNTADLRVLDWSPGFAERFPLFTILNILPLLVLGAGLLVTVVARRPALRPGVPWRVALWTAPMLAASVIAFTVGVLVVDTAKTSSWTLLRQNIQTIRGDPGCGLADDLLVPARGSIRPVASAGSPEPRDLPPWVPPAPVAGLDRFVLAPAEGGSGRSAWFELPVNDRIGLFVTGTQAAPDRLALEWGRSEAGRIDILGDAEIETDTTSDVSGGVVLWRFVATGELPAPNPQANVVRVVFRSADLLATTLAVTAPVTYANQELAPALNAPASRSFINPKLLTYFPCARQPLLRDGIVEVPNYVVGERILGEIWPLGPKSTSPFNGILDIYGLERLPIADSLDPPEKILVFGAARQIPGEVLASPDKTPSS